MEWPLMGIIYFEVMNMYWYSIVVMVASSCDYTKIPFKDELYLILKNSFFFV